jgi:signal transduction histidine kinase/CheY-like chemotaxis protein
LNYCIIERAPRLPDSLGTAHFDYYGRLIDSSAAKMAGNKALTTMEEAQRRTWYLRVAFVITLVIAAAICGLVSYFVVDDLEQNVGFQTYESIAVSALEGATAIASRKLQGNDAMASVWSYAFPDAEQWPMVFLDGYPEIGSKVAKLSSSMSVGVIPLVKPEESAAFEEHAARSFKDHDFPEGAGMSEFGFGIWATDTNSNYSDGRVHDTTGATSYESGYNFLAPVFQHNVPNASSVMYNVHSNEFRGRAIDSILDCAAEADEPKPSCVVMTDFVELIVRPGPATLMYGPIYPANNPRTVVGLVGTSVHFEEVLTNVVPDYVDGLYCVISTDQSSFTYVIHAGEPRLVGPGDLHDPSFDKWGHSVVLNDINTGARAFQKFTLTVYPTNLMLDEFRTNSPLAIALGFVGVILLCAAVFFAYDFFMMVESRQNKIVLEVKRRFVRFVSHEVRTPLNTVCMGLELLQAELVSQIAAAEKDNPQPQSQHIFTAHQEGNDDVEPEPTQSPFKYLLDLTRDILDNSESAVTILNDLLNYDKIESGTFQLEIGVVPIWDLVRRTVLAFDIQARKKKVALNFIMEKAAIDTTDGSSDEEEQKNLDFSMLNVVGDDMRLRQVVLNLVSNALKFVPENDGIIDVTVSFDPDGLAGNRPLYTTKDGGALEPELIAYPRDGAIRISVRDNGEGMTEDQLKLLFREGVQFDANQLQAGGGSGLGLYISKGLVEQHGGDISVESEGRHRGSTFIIQLPIYRCPRPTDAESANSSDTAGVVDPGVKSISASAEDTSPPQDKSRRILVVDDAAMNRKMLIRLLEWAGHTCDSAANGQEAVDAVLADEELAKSNPTHERFDTILMDFEMPILNGPDATKQIRGHGCKAFVVGVTGNVLTEDVKYFKSKGADLVLAKPLHVKTLEEAWRKHKR